MKIKLITVLASVIFFESASPFVFSSAIQSSSEKSLKKFGSSSSSNGEVREMPIITNEAEYAEFQKQRELAGRASSSLSSKSNTNSSYSSKSISK